MRNESLETRAQKARSAYLNATTMAEYPDTYVCEVFDEYLIAGKGDKYFKVPYAIDGDAVTFGEAVEVRREFVTVTEALEALTLKGTRWEVRLMREGVNKKTPPWIYTRKALESLLPFIDGAPLRAVESVPGVYGHNGKAKIIGKLVNARAQESGGFYEPVAEAEIAEESVAWLAGEMKAGRVNGVSINAPVEAVTLPNGFVWPMKFLGLESLDLATVPAAGGAFLRATESVAEREFMKLEDIIAMLKKHRREDLVAELGDNPTIEQATEALEAALATSANTSHEHALTAQEAQDMRALVAQTKIDSADAYLTRKLAECNLPEPVKKKVQKQFAGKAFAREALDEALTAEKEMLDALGHSGQVSGAGETRIEMGQEAVDKIQIALDKTLGVKVEGHGEIKPWNSFRKAYVQITGDSEISGRLPAYKLKAQEAISASDFPNLLGTSMNRRLLQDYAKVNYGQDMIISQPYQVLENFKPQEGERVGYFGDLSTVDPETGDYTEATRPGEEKVSGTPIQKGNILTITRKTIMNDDLRGITKRVQGWGRAAERTFARYVWAPFMNNATYTGDATAWFTGPHGNLSSGVLNAANLSAAVDLLAAMTEPSSAEKLGLSRESMARLILVVPQALRATAFKINQAQYLDAAFTPNDLYQLFGANNERILVNPMFTDNTDWGLFRDPSEVDIMVVGFVNGQVEPEIFIADQPTVGQMFVADKLQWKIRHEYMAYIGDYRGAVKSVQ